MTAEYRMVDVQSFTLSIVLLLLSACSVYALDAPHNESNGIGCDSCHDITSSQPKRMPAWTAHPPVDIDDTQFNTLCWSCHNEVIAPYMKTHSSLQADDDYGNWSVECWVCHNQHAQDQFRAYGGASYLYSGTSATVATSTLSVSGDPWTVNQYAGYILIPNIASPYYNYTITGNTTNTLTVQGPIDLSEVTDGDSFAIVYGKLIRSRLVLDDIIDQSLPAPYVRSGDKTVRFLQAAGPGYVDKVNPIPQGICQVCHTQTTYWLADGTQQNHFENRECIDCHKHSDGFIHGGGETDCGTCHGHEDGYSGSLPGTYKGSTQSHSTHTESDDDFVGPRPVLACADCHNTAKLPKFRSKADPNAELTLAQTDICNDCHSGDGPYDGLNDAVVGAKANWRNGIYTTNGSSLKTGKERWCVTCHDSGTSNINGRQAPDVAGDNSTWGYYVSGHGSAVTECNACHGLAMPHNFDGKKTYAKVSNNYKQGYRLSDVDGQDPMIIPNTENTCASYSAATFRLCYSCHNEEALIKYDTNVGVYECSTNPYPAGTITTGFRNESTSGLNGGTSDVPANIHWDHLADVNTFGNQWYSEGPGLGNSNITCLTCHNPHGDSFGGNATKRMTHGDFEITWGTDGIGDYGQVGPGATYANRCAVACHGVDTKYYRDHPPILNSISVTDNISSDPSAAEAGYTNSQSVTVTITNSGTTPTHMEFAEDPGFSVNSTGWLAFNATYTYSLTAGEGSKSIFGRLKDATHQSAAKNATIVLDTTNPIVGSSSLTSPNGAETWNQDTLYDITWSGVADTSLKASPITLNYSTDSGGTYPNTIVFGEVNDGTHQWTVPAIESSTVKVRLTATDKAGNQASDASNGDFIIQPTGAAVLSSITVTDNNSFDPAAAEAGYTNNNSVNVSFTISNNPTEMICAQDAGFSTNLWPDNAGDGWGPYASPFTYPISGGDGSYTVYCKVRNILGASGNQNDTITLDTTDPAILATTLTAPNGNADPVLAEFWTRGSTQTITWTSTDISDTNLKTNPIFLKYSWNSGGAWPGPIANDEANDGSYDWTVTANTTHNARISLAARDKAGNEAYDASDNDFNISPPYIVTNTSDAGVGSLRQVITDLEAAGGNSPIWFNIPDTDPSFVKGVAVIGILSDLPPITKDDIIIDGGSQTNLQGDTNPNGPEIRINKGGTSTTGFNISGGGVYIESLQITGFTFGVASSGYDTSLEYNQFGFSSDTDGYTSIPNGQGASLSGQYANSYNQNYFGCASSTGLNLSDSSDAYVNDNVFGLFPDGTPCPTTGASAIHVGNAATDASISSNIISGSTYGINLVGSSANTTIRGNQIGVYYSGGSWIDAVSPTYAGVYLNTSGGGNVIGGPSVATTDDNLRNSNVIKPSSSTHVNWAGGIYIYEAENYTTKIFGNFIGTNPEKDEMFCADSGAESCGRGIMVRYVYGVTIGGSDTGEAGNVITNMSAAGVELYNSNARYVDIRQNSFYDNGNDTGDDAIFLDGGNNFISRPTISAASTSTVTVSGVSSGSGSQAGDIVEVYLSDFDGTEYGEGKTFIGSAVVATGNPVDVDISGAGLNPGDWITATRTNHYTTIPTYQTSAFSTNARIPGPAAPTLAWTGEPNYESDGLDPDSGAHLNSFTFRVKYTDADNDPPWPIKVLIDVNDDDFYDVSEPFAMTEVDAGDTDYTDGKLYTFSVSLALAGDGALKYRFNASDGASAATGPPTSDNTFEVTNTAPTLDWTGESNYESDGVDPESALSGSDFTFRVKYTDADNNPPSVIEVWIDEDGSSSYEAGEKYAMTGVDGDDTVYTDGKFYTLTRPVIYRTGGMRDYRFYAADGVLDATGSPTANNFITLQGCGSRPVVNPAGTYFEAENFTSSIVQGSYYFTVGTNPVGFNGPGFLIGSNTNLVTPPTQQGKEYELDFPTAGTYNIWLRSYDDYGATWNSVFVGLDGAWTAALGSTSQDTWEWTNFVEVDGGSGNTIVVGTAGYHTFNIWVREGLYRVDGIYLTTGAVPPTDVTVPSGATVIDPSVCLP